MIFEFQGIVSHYFVTVCFKIVALQQHNLVYKKNYLKLESLIPIGQFTKGRIGFCSSSTVDINNSNGHDLIRFLSLFSVFFFASFIHRKPFIFSLHLLLVLCSLLFTFFFLYRFIFFSFLSFSSSPYANLIDFCFVYRSEKKEQL